VFAQRELLALGSPRLLLVVKRTDLRLHQPEDLLLVVPGNPEAALEWLDKRHYLREGLEAHNKQLILKE
jgi:hypothetical protein